MNTNEKNEHQYKRILTINLSIIPRINYSIQVEKLGFKMPLIKKIIIYLP